MANTKKNTKSKPDKNFNQFDSNSNKSVSTEPDNIKGKVEYPGVIDGVEVDNMVERIKRLVEIAREARDDHPNFNDDFEKAMIDAQNIFLGRHVDVFNTSALGLSDVNNQYIVENHINTAVKVTTGIVTANRPGFQWKPPDTDKADVIEAADLASKSFDLYSTQNMGIEDWYPDACRRARIYGHVNIRLHHTFENGATGKDKIDILSPLATFIDPAAHDWDRAKYRGAVIIEDKLRFKAHWENFLKKKIDLPNYTGLDTTEVEHWDMRYKNDKTSALEDYDQIDKGLTIILEYDDQERIPRKKDVTETKEVKNPETGEMETKEVSVTKDDVDEKGEPLSTIKKYPNGRLFIVFENDLVYDGVNPYDHKESQFLVMQSENVDDYFFGIGYPHQYWDIQKNINEAVTQININCALTSNPKMYHDPAAYPDNHQFSNIGGTNDALTPDGVNKHMLSGGQPIKRYELGDNTGQAQNRYVELLSAFYRLVGIEEAVRGESKSGDSGVKVENLYINAVQRFRPDVSKASRYILKPYANRLMSNMIQFKVNERVNVGGNDEGVLQGVNIFENMEVLQQNKVELQLRLVIGSETPDQRSFRANQLLQYFQLLGPEVIPPWILMTNSDNIDLIKLGKTQEMQSVIQIQNQMKLAQMLQVIEQVLPVLQQAAAEYQANSDMEQFGEVIGSVAAALQNAQGAVQQQTANQA